MGTDEDRTESRRPSAPVTAKLAQFIVRTKYEDIPGEVVRLAKNSFLDTLGIALAGTVEDAPSILSRFAREAGSSPVASVIGKGFKSAARDAALINGTSADVIGFSDISVINMHHPSVPVCAAMWAIGEQYRSTGKALITAHVLGVEVSDKISSAIRPGFQKKGWHPLAVLGTFGATAASGKLLGLDAGRMANALGIAAQEASGLRATMGTMSKAYGGGRGAENGVVAAKLAQMGFTGPTDVFEARNGFLQTFGGGAGGEEILEHLGAPYEFESPGITLKRFPTCTRSHNAIQGVLELKRKHAFSADDVESVECSVTPAVADLLKYPSPRNKLEAKYSLEFCVALALLEGRVVIAAITDDRVNEPKMLDLMRRVKMVVSADMAALGYNPDTAPFGCTVTIKLRNGLAHTCRVDKGPWEPATPPSWDELLEKYRSCAETVLSREKIDESIDIVRNLERAEDISRLMDIVRT